MVRYLPWILAAGLATSLLAGAEPRPDPETLADLGRLRLSQIQLIGTHNSYHVAPDAVAARFLQSVAPREAAANDVSLPPLGEQLDRLGVRQLELDLFLDPDGRLYQRPTLLELAKEQRVAVPPHDPEGHLGRPGIKILHSPDFDYRTTVYTLGQALREVRAWSQAHPDHVPLFLLLELKSESFSPLTKPPAWNRQALDELEREITAELPRERILTPDLVRGSRATLREAVLRDGWPTVAAARGKIVLLLDNEDAVRDEYLRPSPALAGRLMFASVGADHPAAAWMKRNDPRGSFDEIRRLVQAGFLVRTRADSSTREARANDGTTRDRAFASGAQLISTDFPEPDPRFSEYAVSFADGRLARRNVVEQP